MATLTECGHNNIVWAALDENGALKDTDAQLIKLTQRNNAARTLYTSGCATCRGWEKSVVS